MRLPHLSLAALLSVGLAWSANAATFRFADQQDVAMMDPYGVDETFTTGFLASIYEPLLRRGRHLEIEPALAERYEQLDPRHWRFYLRGAKFQDGSDFTSADVLFSLARVRKPGSAMVNRVATIETVTAVDDHTVDITTRIPDPTLPANLTAVLIMSKAWADAHGATDPVDLKAPVENFAVRNAMGTGPFRLVRRNPGEVTELAANPTWWDHPEHNLTQVLFTPINTAATRIAALLSGGIDMMEPVPVQDQQRLAADPNVTLMTGPELRSVFLGMDVWRPELLYSSVKGRNPLADLRVRRAFYAAIDVYAIRDRLMFGQSQPTAEIAGPGIVGFDPASETHPPADVAKASQLMTEAGYPDGFDLTMNCPAGRYVNDEAICQAIAAMLARIKVHLTVVTQPPAAYFGRLARRDTSFYLLGTTPPTYDAFSTVFGLLACPTDLVKDRPVPMPGQGSFNQGGYCNPQMDALIADAQSQMDPTKRLADFAQVWQININDVATIPLHRQALAWGVRKGIKLEQRPDNVLDLRFVVMP
jgi:peptide/nickel transport system substrate-binding protein